MDVKLFNEMMNDKHFCNYKKLKYKYDDSFNDFILSLYELYCKKLFAVFCNYY